jgi:15-cis-phytoene synthase
MPARPDLPPIRALVWLYCGAERRAFASLCGIECEIGASLEPGVDHQVAHTRLAWWREECARCAAGAALHPLTSELSACFAPELGPLGALAGLVDTAVWDLASAPFETLRELHAYCERWSAALIEPLARHAAPHVPQAPVRGLGRSLREIELLLALVPDAHAGRLRLPLDELQRAGVTPESLARPPWPEGLCTLLRGRYAELRAALGSCVAELGPEHQAPLRGLLVWAALAARGSERAQRNLPRAASARDYHAPLDGWHAWRTARLAAAGRLRLAAAA